MPAMQGKLFDTLVLPIVSYTCEIWGVSPSIGKAAGVLHRASPARIRCCKMHQRNWICRGWSLLIAGPLLALEFALSLQGSSIRQFSPCQACKGWCLHFSLLQQQKQRLRMRFRIFSLSNIHSSFIVLTLHYRSIGLLPSVFMTTFTAPSSCTGPCSLSTSMHVIFLHSSGIPIGGC